MSVSRPPFPLRLLAAPRRFLTQARGSVSIETLLIAPLLFWALVATVVFFDGFRARNQAQLAAQTVADLLSRETQRFTTDYLEGMNDVFDFIAQSRFPTAIRVSSVIWDSTEQRNRLQWSYGTRSFPPLHPDTFRYLQSGDYSGLITAFSEDAAGHNPFTSAVPRPDLADRIPPVLPGEALILVESFAYWTPFFDVGVGRIRLDPVVVTRPRFSPWVNLEGTDPVLPENDYEVVFTGYVPGNPSLPDPTQPNPNVPDPTQPDPSQPGPDPADPVQPPITQPPRLPPGVPIAISQPFDDGVTTGWSRTTITPAVQTWIYNRSGFLGPFGNETYATPLTFTVPRLRSPVAAVTFQFDLLTLNSWDGLGPSWVGPEGDNLTLFLNGAPIALEHFKFDGGNFYYQDRRSVVWVNGSVVTTTATLLRKNRDHYIDDVWRITVTVATPPTDLTLGFSARLDEDLTNESFGIDNFTVTFADGAIPAPVPVPVQPLLTTDSLTRFPVYGGCPDIALPADWLNLRNRHLASQVVFNQNARGRTAIVGPCPGVTAGRFADASPSFVLDYDNEGMTGTGRRLRIRAEDGNNGFTCDSTLTVRDPLGQWWYNDDEAGGARGWNPGLNLGDAPTGVYHVWVGTFNSAVSCQTRVVLDRY